MAAAAVGGVEEAAQLDRLAAELFRRADRNGDLSLSHTEMKKLLKQAGVREQMHIAGEEARHMPWKQFWKEIDLDGDGTLDLPEFQAFLRRHMQIARVLLPDLLASPPSMAAAASMTHPAAAANPKAAGGKVLQQKQQQGSGEAEEDLLDRLARELFGRVDHRTLKTLLQYARVRELHFATLQGGVVVDNGTAEDEFWNAVNQEHTGALELPMFQAFLRGHMDIAHIVLPELGGDTVPTYRFPTPSAIPESVAPTKSNSATDVGAGGIQDEAAQLDRLAAELFRRADRNGDLSLSHTEMKKLLKQAGVREQMHIAGEEARHMPWKRFWKEIDLDGDGTLDLPEFQAFLRRHTQIARVLLPDLPAPPAAVTMTIPASQQPVGPCMARMCLETQDQIKSLKDENDESILSQLLLGVCLSGIGFAAISLGQHAFFGGGVGEIVSQVVI